MRGVSVWVLCGFLLLSSDCTEALKKALADSKFEGVNVGLLPLSVDSSDHEPSMSDVEQYLTALAKSTHSGKVNGSSPSPLAIVMSQGLLGLSGV